MNLRGARALIKHTWTMWLQQRSFFFLLAFGWMIPPLVYLFVWSTVAEGGTVGGLTRGQFVAYYLALILVNQLTFSQTNWTARLIEGTAEKKSAASSNVSASTSEMFLPLYVTASVSSLNRLP